MPKKPDRVVQMYDESWYLDKFDHHVCCDCELTHDVSYQVENGRIFTRWKRNERATKAARKKAGIKVMRANSKAD